MSGGLHMRTCSDAPGAGHNGGPPLDEPAGHGQGRCRECRHWRAPPEAEQSAYEFFRLGLSRRRVRRPAGTCNRVVLSAGRAAFSSTSAEFGCVNFEAKPELARPSGGGFVTIYEGGRVVWQGPEEAVPARFAQEELDLFGPGDP